jgi:hypothetical protein
LVQRKAAAVIQDGELVHVDVHASLISMRQLRPRAEANDRNTHSVNDNATPPAAGSAGPRHQSLTCAAGELGAP